jgi:hypothetical protein
MFFILLVITVASYFGWRIVRSAAAGPRDAIPPWAAVSHTDPAPASIGASDSAFIRECGSPVSRIKMMGEFLHDRPDWVALLANTDASDEMIAKLALEVRTHWIEKYDQVQELERIVGL